MILFVFVSVLFFSCKKEEQAKPEEPITYTHWYKTRSGSLDTLFSIYFPNAFSPNFDGKNDYFRPLGNFTGNYYNFRVFNRDGGVIFFTGNKNSSWDGGKRGYHVVKEAVYIYQIKLNDSIGSEYEYTGAVALYK
ncbi:MAG: gliding motility-associated C-terminal domain-containing protein [Bacteroidota bacterium]